MAKRDTYLNQPATPAYPVDPKAEAAQHLRLVAGRYLNGRANEHDVDEAITIWREALSIPGGGRP